jgi:hypothetical protein
MTEPIKRLLEFVETHGGNSIVAKKAKISAQVFTNYKNPERKNENVGGEIHYKMKQAFSDYNADYILTGFNEVAQLKKEVENIRQEKMEVQDYYLKKEMKQSEHSNFNEVYTSSQLADNLDAFENMKPETQELFTGREFKKVQIVFAEA